MRNFRVKVVCLPTVTHGPSEIIYSFFILADVVGKYDVASPKMKFPSPTI